VSDTAAASADDQTSAQAIAERLRQVEERVAAACERVGRDRDEITLVAVSKTFPPAAIQAARETGLSRFGENRARELRDKAREQPGVVGGGGEDAPEWHMVGHLQRNKAKFVARHADVFQALDSPRLADELDKRAAKNDRTLPCLVQVNITGAEQKYGLAPEHTHAFLDELASREHLHVEGLMAMASFTDDDPVVRGQFQQLKKLFDTYDASDNPQVEMGCLSMGMSGDFEIAVEEGATMLRLGSALFGPRDYD
jgi:pyridoxal phosphate enzyme (YggS family)